MAYDVNDLFKKALERATQTVGTFQPDEDGRKVGDMVGGVVVEFSEINHVEYGHSPGTVLRPLTDEMKVEDPANPGTKADLVNFLWLGEVLKAAYYRYLPDVGDIVVARVNGQRESRTRKPQYNPVTKKKEPVTYWDWTVVVYDPNTGVPKLPATMRRDARAADPNTGEIHGAPTPGPGQTSFPPFADDDSDLTPDMKADLEAARGSAPQTGQQ